ncbi:unnamed protein product [Paramecium octaurelia]|uniref:Uncharacterized protein n=1 Tax=Paramecium octaurelia TaxID=43137 RepID=A0A8S1V2D4_PAROT|nr:unnamed protein product [Paramecium octaurelia]
MTCTQYSAFKVCSGNPIIKTLEVANLITPYECADGQGANSVEDCNIDLKQISIVGLFYLATKIYYSL